MSASGSPFSAADSALGYLFQCRYALLDSLRRIRQGEDFVVSIETLDDVVFEPKGKPEELLQTKHHKNREASLNDFSPDLWKTIRIWCEGTLSGHVTPDAVFYLLTTSTASADSAASFLRHDDKRDVDTAFAKLKATAQTSTNKTNVSAYAVFLKNETKVRPIFDRAFVLDSTQPITELSKAIQNEVRLAVKKKFLDSFVERIEGWWLARVIVQMSDHSGPILSEELDAQMSLVREQLRDDNLPIDDSIIDAAVDFGFHIDKTFVKQLQLINLTNPRILSAIREYFRAYAQRSRWVREDLLLVGELSRYETRLIEEWNIFFDRMREDLGDEAAEQQKVDAARALYNWAESEARFPIRPLVSEPFVTRGSFHLLADELKLGWHIDFAERIKKLLDDAEVGE